MIRYDAVKGHIIFCHLEFVIQNIVDEAKVKLEFFEYNQDFELVSQTSYITDHFMVMHDWTITENYYIVPQNPAVMVWDNLFQFLLGFKRGVDVFRTAEEKKGSILLIPRGGPKGSADTTQSHSHMSEVIQCPADNFFNIFHMGPTYEIKNEKSNPAGDKGKDQHQVVMHGVVFDSYTFGGEMGFDINTQTFNPTAWSTSPSIAAPRLDKFVLDVATKTIASRSRIPLISSSMTEDKSANIFIKNNEKQHVDIPVDMPTYGGLHRDAMKCRYVYFTGGRQDGWFPFRYIVKTDLDDPTNTQSWYAGDGRIVSEPIFVPHSRSHASSLPSTSSYRDSNDTDEGYVFSMISNAVDERNELAIFNAKNITAGPISVLNLGSLAPWSVHGYFLPTN